MALNSFNRILCVLTITFIFLDCVNCEAYVIQNATHPDYPNKCYFAGPPVTTLNIGETRRLSQKCYKLVCDKGYSLYVAGCGVYRIHEHCRFHRGDLSKPYPDCCPEYIC